MLLTLMSMDLMVCSLPFLTSSTSL